MSRKNIPADHIESTDMSDFLADPRYQCPPNGQLSRGGSTPNGYNNQHNVPGPSSGGTAMPRRPSNSI